MVEGYFCCDCNLLMKLDFRVLCPYQSCIRFLLRSIVRIVPINTLYIFLRLA